MARLVGSDRIDLLWLNRADPVVAFGVLRDGKLLHYQDAERLNACERHLTLQYRYGACERVIEQVEENRCFRPVFGPEGMQAGGIHVSAEVARRVACDAGLVVLRHAADGAVLDVGRRTRTIPTALRRAVQSRDRNQCQFPGCDSRHCDAHHVVHWTDGGETRLTNLVS